MNDKQVLTMDDKKVLIDMTKLTDGERMEMKKLGILSDNNQIADFKYPSVHIDRPPIEKHAVHAPQVINEAYNYQKPSSFSRALRLDLGGYKIFLLSGTASVNEEGKAEYIGDFKAQLWRTYREYNQSADCRGNDLARCGKNHQLPEGH